MDWIDQPTRARADESPLQSACYPAELDFMPEGATDPHIAKAMAQHLVGSMAKYKTAQGARKMLLSRWELMRLIAAVDPDAFDWVLQEYAEHVFAHPPAGGSR